MKVNVPGDLVVPLDQLDLEVPSLTSERQKYLRFCDFFMGTERGAMSFKINTESGLNLFLKSPMCWQITEIWDPQGPGYLGLLQDSPCLCFLWWHSRSLLGIPSKTELKGVKERNYTAPPCGQTSIAARKHVLTGSINMVPGGPRIPSAPGRPGRPEGPWQQKKTLGLEMHMWLRVHLSVCLHAWKGDEGRERERVNRGKQHLNHCKNNAKHFSGTQCHITDETHMLFKKTKWFYYQIKVKAIKYWNCS